MVDKIKPIGIEESIEANIIEVVLEIDSIPELIAYIDSNDGIVIRDGYSIESYKKALEMILKAYISVSVRNRANAAH